MEKLFNLYNDYYNGGLQVAGDLLKMIILYHFTEDDLSLFYDYQGHL